MWNKNTSRLGLLALSGIAVLTACSTVGEKQEKEQYLFDGVSFTNWEGDTSYWKIVDSAIVGEVTPAHPLNNNTFLLYTGVLPENFELKLDYQISGEGNSGVQYRSQLVAGIPYALKGYQADIDGANTYTGQNYEERGRGFLAKRGESVELKTGLPPLVVDSLGASDALKASIKSGDWNELVIKADGYRLQHFINGQKMSEVLDSDSSNRVLNGILGLQLHVAPQMWVRFRNIRLAQSANQ